MDTPSPPRTRPAINAAVKGRWSAFPWNLATPAVTMPITLARPISHFQPSAGGGGGGGECFPRVD
jgi:hypothetical protein